MTANSNNRRDIQQWIWLIKVDWDKLKVFSKSNMWEKRAFRSSFNIVYVRKSLNDNRNALFFHMLGFILFHNYTSMFLDFSFWYFVLMVLFRRNLINLARVYLLFVYQFPRLFKKYTIFVTNNPTVILRHSDLYFYLYLSFSF